MIIPNNIYTSRDPSYHTYKIIDVIIPEKEKILIPNEMNYIAPIEDKITIS